MNALARFRTFVCATACWLTAAGPAHSAADVLVLAPDKYEREMTQYVQFLRDSTHRLSISEIVEGEAGTFRTLPGSKIDFGFIDDTIWLKLMLINQADLAGTWTLSTNVNFMHWLEAYLVRDGRAQLIVKDSENAPFSARPIPYRHIAGKFRLAAGEGASILIGYRSDGSSSLPLAIETEASFFEQRTYEAVKNTAFYTAAAAMIVFSLVFMPVARRRLQLAYAVYVSWVVLYAAHLDGYTLQFLWPELPRWNAFASLPLGYGIAAFAAVFAREFLGTRSENKRLDMVLRGIVWTSIAFVVSALFIDIQWLKKFGFIYICIVAFILFGSGFAGLRYRRPGARFFILSWLGIIVGAIYATFAHWKPGALPVGASVDFIHGGMFFQWLMLALAITEQLRSFKRQRDAAVLREMRTLEENVALERSHAYAQALADSRRAQLANASHDLKQPLISLRLMLRRAMGPHDEAAVVAMRRSIDYLESLVRRYLQQSGSGSTDGTGQRHGEVSFGENFKVAVILDNVVTMFADEAQAKGRALRSVRTSACVHGDPVAVMRIVANFVSNAVKHSSGSKVLVGCRRRKDRLRIEVHDMGPGLSDERLKSLRNAYETGERVNTNPDVGLGLTIALQLIAENGYEFDVTSRKWRGTAIALILPVD